MKKVLFILTVLLLSNMNFVWSTMSSGDNNIIINKDTPKDSDKERPRDLLQVPITCMYQEGSLCFTFYEDLGELEITVTNQSTGAITIYPYDAVSGSVVVGVSNESAPYLIEIETISGDCYWGEYTL
jgi:hypothetical protein